MNFEQTAKQYLLNLQSQKIIIDGWIIGVDEEFQTATCVARFLEITESQYNTVNERYIIVRKEDEELTWNFLEPLKNDLNNEN